MTGAAVGAVTGPFFPVVVEEVQRTLVPGAAVGAMVGPGHVQVALAERIGHGPGNLCFG